MKRIGKYGRNELKQKEYGENMLTRENTIYLVFLVENRYKKPMLYRSETICFLKYDIYAKKQGESNCYGNMEFPWLARVRA